MLAKGADNNLFEAHAAEVQAPAAMQAYRFMIGWGIASALYACQAAMHGVVRDVRYTSGDAQYFAFIPNRQWLLFYFRRPCAGLPKYSFTSLQHYFPAAKKTSGGEITVRLASLADAVELVRYIEN